jgi:hypothetical protein
MCACNPLQLARLKGRYEKKWIEDISINGTEDVNADAEFEAVLDRESGELEVRRAYVCVCVCVCVYIYIYIYIYMYTIPRTGYPAHGHVFMTKKAALGILIGQLRNLFKNSRL